MARAAATPSIMYGVETMGISDTALPQARSKVAAAAAPKAGGKNPDLTLHTLDGAYGTLDPAFDAHVLPIVRYATAWWEQWQSHSALTAAFRMPAPVS